MARLDELTGVRNKNAFKEYISSIDKKLEGGMDQEPFAIVMCDVNDLKLINDTRGRGYPESKPYGLRGFRTQSGIQSWRR